MTATINETNPAFPVIVYGKPDHLCFGCKKTKAAFERAGVQFEHIDLTLAENETTLEELRKAGKMQAPYVITPNDEWTGLVADKIAETITAYQAATAVQDAA